MILVTQSKKAEEMTKKKLFKERIFHMSICRKLYKKNLLNI